MWTMLDRLPMSRANAVLCVALAIGAAAAVAAGLWPQAVMLGLILLLGIGGVAWARRPGASDVSRVNAIEYRDERDRRIAWDGFAIVGIVALLLSLAAYMVGLLLSPALTWALLGQMLVLYVTWGVANGIVGASQPITQTSAPLPGFCLLPRP